MRDISAARLVGENFRRLRGTTTQAEVAAAARNIGLKWNSTRVSDLEMGKKPIYIDECLLLPRILQEATGHEVNLYELLPASLIS